MGGALGTAKGKTYVAESLSKAFHHYQPKFKTIMPQPERWDELMENIAHLWNETDILPLVELKKIKCPVLLLYGDRDQFCKLTQVVEIYNCLPNAQLAVFPNARHLDVSPRNITILEQYITTFLNKQINKETY
jgi:pimeloyl-ACP methyl ester carboxylesterase